MRRLLLSLCVLGSLAANAQTVRTVQPALLWPEAQGELALKNGDYLLLAFRGEQALANEAGPSRAFDAYRAMAAYEHFWNPRWSWGGTLRLTGGSDLPAVLVPELLLRHRAPLLGGITFGQRLSLERTFYTGGSGPGGQFWSRLRVDVEKLLPLGADATGLALRPRLSYEASTHLRLQKAATDYDERTIQFTGLRGEVGVRVSSHVDFTPWFAYQTIYSIALPQYDIKGNQVRGGNYNNVYPTVGLDLRYTILPADTKADRQQLPTQH